jgi:hypothetical protein
LTPLRPRIAVTLLEESEALHERVRRFAEAPGDFSALAYEIAEFQARWSPGYRRLLDRAGAHPQDVQRLPGVPVRAFRLTRVAVHPAELDRAVFVTSGTTEVQRGRHAFRTLETYRALSLRFARTALLADRREPCVVVALGTRPAQPETSSLSFMMKLFIEHFDGRALSALDKTSSGEELLAGRFLLDRDGIDLRGLKGAVAVAAERAEPLLILATSLALVELVEKLQADVVSCPARTVVMQTGGFKGRNPTRSDRGLGHEVARALAIDPARIVGEYGMTELTSQLYEGHLPGGGLTGEAGFYREPPWLRVVPVHPVSLEPVGEGEVGLAKIIDLGNVDSAVAIVTEDLVVKSARGVELRGRSAGAVSRGCSLATEALLAGG